MTERARFSAPALRLFELPFRPFLATRLRAAVYLPPRLAIPADRPLVLVSSHVSWWDGFLLRELHRRVAPERPLFTLMLARELRRFPFFRALGAFPLDATTGGVLRAFRALERLRARDPGFCVSYFAQGRIRPSWARPLGFQRGIELLVRRLAPCTVLPVALHIEPLNHVRPTAFINAGATIAVRDTVAAGEIEARIGGLLDSLMAHIAAHGEQAADRAVPHPVQPS